MSPTSSPGVSSGLPAVAPQPTAVDIASKKLTLVQFEPAPTITSILSPGRGKDHQLNCRHVPELPDVTVYVERLAALTRGQALTGLRISSPFVLRSVDPTPAELVGAAIVGVSRMGKRIVIEVTGDRFIVIHLMIAGRLRWKEPRAPIPGKIGLAAFDFAPGTL